MPRNPRVITDKAIPAALRRRFARISDSDRPGPSRAQRAAERRSIVRKHRADLGALLTKENAREFAALRKRLANATRSVRLREVDRFLCRIGYDHRRARELGRRHLKALGDELDDWRPHFPITPPLPGRCSPTVEYRPPYQADFIVPYVDTEGDINDPVITPYIDHLTGDIGSHIKAGMLEADDDDMLYVDYYTAFRLLHTTIGTGPILIDLDFRIVALHLDGKARDEWGSSNLTARQTVNASLRVMSVALPDENQHQ